MEPRLDAEVETLNLAIDAEETARIAADALKVAKAGDTMTGALTLNADPTNNLHAATKQYVDASNLPAGGADGQVLAKASGTDFDAEWIDNYAEKTYYLVRNNTGSTIPKGTLVAAVGAEPSGRVDVEPFETTGLQDSELRVMGMAVSSISNGVNGEVISFGTLTGLDTRGSTASAIAVGDETWAEGDILYAHPTAAGKLTKVRPQHDLAVAFITVRHASTGQLAIRIVPGNFHLAWLHDVDIDEGTLTDGQALTYDDASGLWVNATPVNSLAGLSDVTLTSPVVDQVLKYDGTDWVNGTGGGGASVTVSDTAPTTPEADALWYDSTDGTLYVYYEDVDGSQWVQVQANSALTAGIESRVGALESQAIAYGNPNPNVIINGGFDIWQRGTSFTPTNGVIVYTADRFWVYRDTGSAVTVSRQTFSPGSAPSANVSAPYFYRFAQTTTGSGGSLNLISQYVEDARTFAGRTVTYSFWAKADAARTITPQISRGYGSGGSAEETIFTGSAITLTTSWARYSVTVPIPTISGKTVNDASNSNIALTMKLANNTVQTVDVWGVQLEVGSTATSFRRNAPSIQGELAACQRYYVRFKADSNYGWFSQGQCYSSGLVIFPFQLPVTMRSNPGTTLEWSGSTSAFVVRVGATGLSNSGTPVLTNDSDGSPTTNLVQVYWYVTGAGATAGYSARLMAYNSTSGYIGFSAEL
jgi:hypothetical protein